MRPVLFLRIASVITWLFAIGHTLGVRKSWSPLGETDVLKSMETFRFDLGGLSRTYWDFYIGFGLFNSLYLFLEAVLLWQLATIARTDPARVRPLAATLFLVAILSTILSWRFFFTIPVVLSALTAISLAPVLVRPRES